MLARLLSEGGGGESVVEMLLGLLEPEPLSHTSGTDQILRQMATRTQSSSLWLSAIQRVSCPFRIERYLDSDGMCTLENHGVRAGAPAFEYIQPDCAAKNSSKLSAPLVGGKETGHKTHELIQPSEIKCSHCTLSVGSLKQFVCRSCPSTKSRVRATNEELLAATFAFCSQGIANPLAAVLKTNSQGSFRAECQDCNGCFVRIVRRTGCFSPVMTAMALAAMNVVDAMTSVRSACRAMILGTVLFLIRYNCNFVLISSIRLLPPLGYLYL